MYIQQLSRTYSQAVFDSDLKISLQPVHAARQPDCQADCALWNRPPAAPWGSER